MISERSNYVSPKTNQIESTLYESQYNITMIGIKMKSIELRSFIWQLLEWFPFENSRS